MSHSRATPKQLASTNAHRTSEHIRNPALGGYNCSKVVSLRKYYGNGHKGGGGGLKHAPETHYGATL
eukprot:374201-Amphidinium_carterae.1